MFKAADHFYEIVMRFNFSKMRKMRVLTYVSYVFVSKRSIVGFLGLQAIKNDLGDDFYRSVLERLSTLLTLVASLFFVFRLKLRY